MGWRVASERAVNAISVEVDLELGQLSFKVRGIPEENVVKILLTYCADQAFHKRMGEWHVR